MYEIIVRVLRAVACHPRLRILSCVARQEEVAPSQLADELGMTLDLTSAHLTKLTSAGLIQRRRSGLWCYCRAESPYGKEAFSGRLAHWLFALFRLPDEAVEDSVLEQLRDSRSADEALHATIFEAATAFDNVRRLQLIRLVLEREPIGAEALSGSSSMSRSSVTRHVDKLIRRGYLVAERRGRVLQYSVTQEFKTPVHEGLWQIVAAEWQRPRNGRA